jgi:hypothetical protein
VGGQLQVANRLDMTTVLEANLGNWSPPSAA